MDAGVQPCDDVVWLCPLCLLRLLCLGCMPPIGRTVAMTMLQLCAWSIIHRHIAVNVQRTQAYSPGCMRSAGVKPRVYVLAATSVDNGLRRAVGLDGWEVG
jgi:hypothetical protein